MMGQKTCVHVEAAQQPEKWDTAKEELKRQVRVYPQTSSPHSALISYKAITDFTKVIEL